jgi:hypothetical protein
MDHYSLTLRTPQGKETTGIFTSRLDTIKEGCYRAVFTMLGGEESGGYINVHWPGLVNQYDTRVIGSVIGCVFGGNPDTVYTGVLYLRNPEPHVEISFYSDDDTLDKTSIKPSICVDLQRIC